MANRLRGIRLRFLLFRGNAKTRLTHWWARVSHVYVVGLVLLLLGLIVIVVGQLSQSETFSLSEAFANLWSNLGTELISVAISVLVIERLLQAHETRQEKARLIRDLGSKDNGIALQAVGELKARRWLQDGSLHGACLSEANLQGADLDGADLRHAKLYGANLRNARLVRANLEWAYLRRADLRGANLCEANLERAALSQAQLDGAHFGNNSLHGPDPRYGYTVLHMGATMYMLYQGLLDGANLLGLRDTVADDFVNVHCLLGATMPNGTRYDGRYNLPGDVEERSPDIAAKCYRISIEDYMRAQEWTRTNLSRLRSERTNT